MKKALCLLFLGAVTVAGADDHKAFVYNEQGKRDPLGPLVSPSGVMISYDTEIATTDISLEGVIIDKDGNNLAIINGKIVKAKDQFGIYMVDAISNDHVDLSNGQQKLTVGLKKGGV